METTLPNIKTVGGVAVPCLVLVKNRIQFIDFSTGVIGKVLNVSCRSIDLDSTGDCWAVPIKDGGVFTGLWIIPKAYDNQGNDYTVNPPTYDSKTCFRVWDNISEDIEWYIYGSRQDFANSCNSCCGAAYTVMPGVNNDGARNFTWNIAPTVELGDIKNVSDVNVSYWGLPTLDAGKKYFPLGSYNDIPFPNASAAGYANTTTLLTWLNANAASVGSPATATLVWTLSGSVNNPSLIATGGDDGDVIGLSVIPV